MKQILKNSFKTISILFLACFFIGISVRVYIYHSAHTTPKEEEAVDYIIENIYAFQNDFKAIGYDVHIISAPNGEILVLSDSNREYKFDVGFDCFKGRTDSGAELLISKNFKEKVLKSKSLLPDYYVNVSLHNEEIEKRFGRSLHNDYELNFVNYFVRTGDDEYSDDKIIKEYISVEELCKIYGECIDLQDKLVALYEEHKIHFNKKPKAFMDYES